MLKPKRHEGRIEKMVSDLENAVGITPINGQNKWVLSGYKPIEIGIQSGKRGIRFVLENGQETSLITAKTLLKAALSAERKYGSLKGCVLEFTCSGEGLGRVYTEVRCEKPSDVEAFI